MFKKIEKNVPSNCLFKLENFLMNLRFAIHFLVCNALSDLFTTIFDRAQSNVDSLAITFKDFVMKSSLELNCFRENK